MDDPYFFFGDHVYSGNHALQKKSCHVILKLGFSVLGVVGDILCFQ